jgi:hypothetical protein
MNRAHYPGTQLRNGLPVLTDPRETISLKKSFGALPRFPANHYESNEPKTVKIETPSLDA